MAVLASVARPALGSEAGATPRSIIVPELGSDRIVGELASALATHLGAELVIVPRPSDVVDAVTTEREPIVCLSTRGHTAFGRPAINRSTVQVVQRLGCPMLVVGPSCRAVPTLDGGQLFICVDGSRRSEAVLPFAAGWAENLDFGTWLLSVVGVSEGPGSEWAGTINADLIRSGYLARLARAMAAEGWRADWEVLHGSSAAAAIVNHVTTAPAAMIAINTHGATAPEAATMGRVAGGLIIHSPVPVVLTRSVVAPAAEHGPTGGLDSGPPRAAPARLTRPAMRAVPTPPLRRSAPPLAVATAPTRHVTSRAWLPIAASSILLVILAATHLPLPYYSLRGDTLAANRLVRVDGAPRFEPTGVILLPVVTARRTTVAGAVEDWMLGDTQLHRTRDVLGRDPAASRLANLDLMEAAKRTAIIVTRRKLGGRLPAGATVVIDSRGIGGPSAGLGFALEVIDLLTPGELTGNGRVAVTGTLDAQGRVGPVGGVAEKVKAARQAGASLLIVPRANYREALAHAPDTLPVVAVGSLDDALHALRQAGGDPW